MVNVTKHCSNLRHSTFMVFIGHGQGNYDLLLTSKILGLLVKTLAATEKYLVLHRDNLTILIQMQLSEKQKNLF